MLSIASFLIKKEYSMPGRNIVQWILSSGEESFADYTLRLYRNFSGSFDDPESKLILEQPSDGANEFVDKNSYSKKRTSLPSCYYWLEIVNIASGEALRSQMARISYLAGDYIYKGIVKNELYGLEKVLKAPFMAILRRRTFGEQCPECFDKFANKTVKDNCSACYGTGFRGGYFYPVKARVQQNTATVVEFVDQEGAVKVDSSFQGWLSNHPIVSVRDVIINQEGHIYTIMQVFHSKFQNGFITRQIITAQRVPYKDVLFSYSLPEKFFE